MDSREESHSIMKSDKEPLIKKHWELIKLLIKLKPKKRKALIEGFKKVHINCISEIFKNFLRKNITTNVSILKKLKKYREQISSVARKSTPLHLKKKVLTSQKGAGLLNILLPVAASVISSIFG